MEELLKYIISNPEQAGETVKALIAQYKPLVYSIIEELFASFKDLVNNDEYYRVSAQSNYKKYHSLCNAGFTEDQAMAIILRDIDSAYNTYRNVKLNSGKSVK